MAKITRQGIEVKSLDEIIDELEKGFRKIYGDNINLDPETPDGQMLGLIAQARSDIENMTTAIYAQLDPDRADGDWLDQRVAYAGLIRKTAAYSYLRSTIITGDPNTQIFKGFTVTDKNGAEWVLVSNITLDGNGSARADFRSNLLGQFFVPKGEILTISTFVLGVEKVEASNDSELGEEIETDQELRSRFKKAHSRNAINSVDAIRGNLFDLADVKRVKILENNTSTIDKNSVKPHTINPIVDGGEDKAIAEIIYNTKGAGVGIQGNTSVTINRDGEDRIIKFDRPVFVDIYAKLTLVRYENFTEINLAEIKKNLEALEFDIGEEVYLSRLYSIVQRTVGFYIKEFKIGKSSATVDTKNLSVGVREIARFLDANIDITEE